MKRQDLFYLLCVQQYRVECFHFLLRETQHNVFLYHLFPRHIFVLVMSGIAGIDTWYRYRYRYLGIERGIDT